MNIRSRWTSVAIAIFTLGIFFTGGAATYAAHLEDQDTFCASCHTQPETAYVGRSSVAPLDLASFHAANGIGCIQCHSGPGASGRITAMATVAVPDLLAYLSGHYQQPATTTVPNHDNHCLKCHGDVTTRQEFSNHFHVFLPLWQAQAPAGSAAGCVDCHGSHVLGGDAKQGYLRESTTLAVCERCHGFAGR